VLTLSSADDPVDLRCFDQKRRFGVDFLYPTDRYVQAFTQKKIAKRSGELVENPLFPMPNPVAGIDAVRSTDLVFVAGIVGVPWQDIARDPSDLTQGLKTAEQMKKDGTWDIILGSPEKGVLPSDPLMHESVGPRSGVQPVTGEPVDTTPDTPNENSINGHEWNTEGRDLQYACIFDLPDATDCPNDPTCSECRDSGLDNPLCDPNAPTMRVRAKAYPGLRQLAVLQGLEKQGIVGSVCPKQVVDRSSPDYGYRPAIGAIVAQLKTKFGGQCMPRTLSDIGGGQVNCVVVEAKTTGGECSCDGAHARTSLPSEHKAVPKLIRDLNPGADWDCFCEIPQLEGDELLACQNDTSAHPETASGEPVSGYCYVDGTTDPPIGDPSLVARCPANDRRMVRLVGDGEPTLGSTLFIVCSGD
jgi:hypothetical protein